MQQIECAPLPIAMCRRLYSRRRDEPTRRPAAARPQAAAALRHSVPDAQRHARRRAAWPEPTDGEHLAGAPARGPARPALRSHSSRHAAHAACRCLDRDGARGARSAAPPGRVAGRVRARRRAAPLSHLHDGRQPRDPAADAAGACASGGAAGGARSGAHRPPHRPAARKRRGRSGPGLRTLARIGHLPADPVPTGLGLRGQFSASAHRQGPDPAALLR